VEPILLVDIEVIDPTKLDPVKLTSIIREFQGIIYRSMEPIRVDRRFGRPFKILDGKHRIQAARHKNQRLIPAIGID
jgi:hypothetical protein